MEETAPTKDLAERLYWLIRLRWLAAAAVTFTSWFSGSVLHVPLHYGALYAVAAALAAYNFVFLLYMNRLVKSPRTDFPIIANRLANAQISLDLLSLAVLLHFSGGIENPFISYFIFHMIIASILLSRRASYSQATFAAALFFVMAGMEYFGFWEHYCISGSGSYCLRFDTLYILGVSAAFVSTLYISVYMATSISVKLRQKEKNLREANLLLKEKDSIKNKYVLRVTHDVKEHLAAVQACLDPVLAGLTGELNQGQRDLVRRSYERAGKLMFFVKALLEITRIKLSKKMETGPFSLKKTAEKAVNLVKAKAEAKNIALTWSVGPGVDIINGSQIYIEETIANFLANSIKYTPNGGSVDLRIGDAGASVLISVSDTGIGIPKDDLPHIFEEFFRAKNARAVEHTGTGLGLSIAREVVERHGGKLWVESEEGSGSVFYMSLPKSIGWSPTA